ncbi:hypothetical protein M0R45_011274 [Rubus argutus]|uniref:Uncharacterized protein n=1 Tax=Rubus argutus TaxID=59490 RepID=A0AAW1YB63_RUBAR
MNMIILPSSMISRWRYSLPRPVSGKSRLCHPQEALGLTILIGIFISTNMFRVGSLGVYDEGGSPSMWNFDRQSSSRVKLLDFDPYKEDSLCLSIGTDIFSYDMASRRWLKTEEKSTQHDVDHDYLFPLVVSPWWPTPIPTLQSLPHLLHAPAVGRKRNYFVFVAF